MVSTMSLCAATSSRFFGLYFSTQGTLLEAEEEEGACAIAGGCVVEV